jgi:hypothetical protein
MKKYTSLSKLYIISGVSPVLVTNYEIKSEKWTFYSFFSEKKYYYT